MHFFALHLNYLSPQLIDRDLLLVEILFKFLYALHFLVGVVGCPPFFLYLYIKVLLHFLLFFFKLVYQIALPSIFFLNFLNFVVFNDFLPLKFSFFFLQLADLLFKLRDMIAQLLVLLIYSFEPHFAHFFVVCLQFFQLCGVELGFVLHFEGADLYSLTGGLMLG